MERDPGDTHDHRTVAVQQHVDAACVLEIEQGLLRIPQAFQEHQIADHLAERMTEIPASTSP